MQGLFALWVSAFALLSCSSNAPANRTGSGAGGASSGLGGSANGGSAAKGGTGAGGGSAGCASGQTCSCPSGQTLCAGACVVGSSCGSAGSASGGASAASGGATAAGGSNNSGGAGAAGAGGALASAVDLKCTLNGSTISVPAADVISDFRQATPLMYAVGARGGTTWYAYGAEDTTAALGASTPGNGSNAFMVDATTSGPCGSGGALKVSSNGNEGPNGWGVGFGVNLMPDIGTTKKKGQFDARAAGYTGIGFFMKCSAETDFAFVKTVDAPNDADVESAVCTYTTAPICNQYGQKNATLLTDWSYHQIHFADTLQDWDGGTITTTGLNATALTAFQIQINTKYTRDGSSRIKNPFTCWIDDVHFLKDSPPSAAPSVAPKACSSTTTGAAPGGYYVSGNAIMDCKTGAAHLFKGVARPSFEWDRAGWNVTYEDLARMASWKANVVRFSLNQSFWLDSAKGALYQAYVDRALKWSLSLGMDVILELHWLTTGQTKSSDASSPIFWGQVAQKYKNEGRVSFELFNEPHDISAAQWNTDMQGLYKAVRDTGANNLVLVGGLDWAYNLAQVLPANALSGTNIAYVTHPYDQKGNSPSAWDAAFGNLATTYPIVATEFGQANTTTLGGALACDANVYTSMLAYFKAKNIGFTAWAWYVDRSVTDPTQTCGFPQVITGYSGATNAAGAVVKSAIGN